MAHATILGRFFSGTQTTDTNETSWGGYGHMGCCSLLVIQQVVSVDPQTSRELDYRASADHPEMNSCTSVRYLTEAFATNPLIEAQAKADRGEREWAFNEPRRVAAEGLAQLLKIDEKSIALKQTREAQGRIIYEWRPKGKNVRYMVVASRPYMLSFYAKDPNRIAWVLLAAYESTCDKKN